MSTIIEGNNYITKEELKRLQNARGITSVWHNPKDDIIYAGEKISHKDGKAITEPTYETAVFDMGKWRKALALKDAGKLSDEESKLQPWMSEFEAMAQERYAVKEAATGVMTNTQYSAIDTTTVMAGMLNTDIRGFSVIEAFTHVPTDGLEYQIDTYTRFNLSINVPEGVPAFAKRGTVATTSFDLTKDVGHVAATDEAQLKSRQDIYAAGIKNITTDFARAKAAKLADILEGATETNVGDYDAFTSGLSDANPLTGISARLAAILANNGVVDTIVSSNLAWNAVMSNTFVHGPYQNFGGTQPGRQAQARIVTGITQLPGVSWHIDDEVLDTSLIILAKEAVYCVDGPTRVGQYRQEIEGIDGYVARQWYQAQIVQSGKIAELVTITT